MRSFGNPPAGRLDWGWPRIAPGAPRQPLPTPIGTPLQLHAQALVRALGAPLASGNLVLQLTDADALQRAVDGARDHVNFDADAGWPAQRSQVVATHGPRAVALNLLRAGWLARWRRQRPLLLVIDGRVAFAGQRAAPLRLEGPVVQALQRRFIERWRRAGAPELPPARYFPPPVAMGPQRIGLPADDAALRRALLAAIGTAQRRICIGRRWRFDLGVQRALHAAVRRGVVVQTLDGAGRAAVIDRLWTLPPGVALVVLDSAFAAETEAALRG